VIHLQLAIHAPCLRPSQSGLINLPGGIDGRNRVTTIVVVVIVHGHQRQPVRLPLPHTALSTCARPLSKPAARPPPPVWTPGPLHFYAAVLSRGPLELMVSFTKSTALATHRSRRQHRHRALLPTLGRKKTTGHLEMHHVGVARLLQQMRRLERARLEAIAPTPGLQRPAARAHHHHQRVCVPKRRSSAPQSPTQQLRRRERPCRWFG
jgi:hypothetical protein